MKYFWPLILILFMPVTMVRQNLLPPIQNYKIFDYNAASKNWGADRKRKWRTFRSQNSVDMGKVKRFNQYLPPYKAAIDARVASAMTSFNDIDKLYGIRIFRP